MRVCFKLICLQCSRRHRATVGVITIIILRCPDEQAAHIGYGGGAHDGGQLGTGYVAPVHGHPAVAIDGSKLGGVEDGVLDVAHSALAGYRLCREYREGIGGVAQFGAGCQFEGTYFYAQVEGLSEIAGLQGCPSTQQVAIDTAHHFHGGILLPHYAAAFVGMYSLKVTV